jgi:hypothetical protein
MKGTKALYLNPGTDRDDVVAAARALGLDPILDCSILAIGVSPAQLV